MRKVKKAKIKKVFVNLSVSLFTFFVMFIIYLIIFSAYRKNLNFYDEVHHEYQKKLDYGPLAYTDVVQLGKAQHHEHCPATSYLYYPQKKPAGKFRIGIFGCSRTFGIEAPKGFDFPTRLQQKYEMAGEDEVEIINFGVGSYGMGRAYYLWDKLGRLYDLDVCIFNVSPIHFDRDNTFVFYDNEYGPIYGRYIIQEGALSYIPLGGNSILENSEIYHSPFQPFQFVRYEYKTPVALRAILPKGRKLKRNPFYYHPDPANEWKELYAAFFDSVAKYSPSFILMIDKPELTALAEKMKTDNMRIFHSHAMKTTYFNQPSVYQAIKSHPSSLGYQIIAEELYHYLHDSTSVPLPFLQFAELKEKHSGADSPQADMQGLTDAYLAIDSFRLSELVAWDKDGNSDHHKSGIDLSQTEGLLAFPIHSWFRFLPIPKVQEDSASLTVSYKLDGKLHEVHLTEVIYQAGILGRMRKLEKIYKMEGHNLMLNVKWKVPVFVIRTNKVVTEVRLKLGGKVILTAEKKQRKGEVHNFSLQPVAGSFLCMKGTLNQKVSIHDLPQKGTLDMVLADKRGASIRIPYLSFSKDSVLLESLK